MKRLAILSLLALALSVGGCASSLKLVADTFDVEVVPEKVKEQAYKAASVSFTAWEGVQRAILKYGQLELCVDGGPVVCRSAKAWARIKEIEGKTSATLLAAKPLIEAGTDDVALLMSIPSVVYDAQAAFQAAQSEE